MVARTALIDESELLLFKIFFFLLCGLHLSPWWIVA